MILISCLLYDFVYVSDIINSNYGVLRAVDWSWRGEEKGKDFVVGLSEFCGNFLASLPELFSNNNNTTPQNPQWNFPSNFLIIKWMCVESVVLWVRLSSHGSLSFSVAVSSPPLCKFHLSLPRVFEMMWNFCSNRFSTRRPLSAFIRKFSSGLIIDFSPFPCRCLFPASGAHLRSTHHHQSPPRKWISSEGGLGRGHETRENFLRLFRFCHFSLSLSPALGPGMSFRLEMWERKSKEKEKAQSH